MSSSVVPARKQLEYRLPALGVRLGGFTEGAVTLAIGDYSGRDAPHCICMVPVVEREGGYHLFRRGDPGNFSDPTPADLGVSIYVDYPGQATHEISRRSAAGTGVDLVPLPHAFERLSVPRDYWGGDPHGVLALTMYFLVLAPTYTDPTADPFADDIAGAIKDALTENLRDRCTGLNELDRLIVPRAAVRVRNEQELFSFALASCQYTLGMVDGTPKGLSPGPGDASYERLGAAIDAGVRFAVLAGDQVYVDATAGLFDPTASRGRFRKPYEQYFGSRVVQDVQRRLPLYMVMDDHEIENNWEDSDDHFWGPLMERWGRPAYVEYERGIGTLQDPAPADVLWQALPIDGHDFFFADTRTRRATRTAPSLKQASILGLDQEHDLGSWLRSNTGAMPRFLVSSSIVLPRRLATNQRPSAALQSDAWDGFPASLETLLSTVASAGKSNLVCLSGDEHLSCFAIATLTSKTSSVRFCSIHCSGLYAPYPFSNSTPADLCEHERFQVQDRSTGTQWFCEVTAEFFQGQGFCVVSVVPGTRGGWTVRAEFNLDSGRQVRDFSVP